MYKRTSRGWVKHLDFIILDVLCLQISFFLAYFVRQHTWNPYTNDFYRTVGILLIIFDLLVAVMMDSMHNVAKRGYYKEAIQTFKHSAVVFLITILWMFSLKNSDAYSRITIYLTFIFHLLISYVVRLLWKHIIKKHGLRAAGNSHYSLFWNPILLRKWSSASLAILWTVIDSQALS